jgi:hypothetical protein
MSALVTRQLNTKNKSSKHNEPMSLAQQQQFRRQQQQQQQQLRLISRPTKKQVIQKYFDNEAILSGR